MKSYFKQVLVLLVAATMLVALPKVEKEIDVQPGQKLIVDLECGADIIIEGWDKNVVELDVEIIGRDEDDVEVEIEETSYGVLVVADYRHHSNSRSTKGKVRAKVPYKFDIDLSTMGGELYVDGVEGELEGTTMGGKLTLKNLKGEVNFNTMGGTIELVDSEVDGEVSTMGGSVLVENVVGDVDASTMGGSVTQRNVKSSGSSTGNEVRIKSMGGAIDIDEAMNGADISTMGGAINVNKASKYVKASTMGGNVTISEVAGWVEASTMGGNVEVNVVGTDGKRDVNISSMGGDIWLTVPADLSMDIEIEIVYDEDDEDEVGVESDFDLTERVEKEGNSSWDDERKLIAYGTIGSGANKIRIETVSGMVHIKKN